MKPLQSTTRDNTSTTGTIKSYFKWLFSYDQDEEREGTGAPMEIETDVSQPHRDVAALRDAVTLSERDQVHFTPHNVSSFRAPVVSADTGAGVARAPPTESLAPGEYSPVMGQPSASLDSPAGEQAKRAPSSVLYESASRKRRGISQHGAIVAQDVQADPVQRILHTLEQLASPILEAYYPSPRRRRRRMRSRRNTRRYRGRRRRHSPIFERELELDDYDDDDYDDDYDEEDDEDEDFERRPSTRSVSDSTVSSKRKATPRKPKKKSSKSKKKSARKRAKEVEEEKKEPEIAGAERKEKDSKAPKFGWLAGSGSDDSGISLSKAGENIPNDQSPTGGSSQVVAPSSWSDSTSKFGATASPKITASKRDSSGGFNFAGDKPPSISSWEMPTSVPTSQTPQGFQIENDEQDDYADRKSKKAAKAEKMMKEFPKKATELGFTGSSTTNDAVKEASDTGTGFTGFGNSSSDAQSLSGSSFSKAPNSETMSSHAPKPEAEAKTVPSFGSTTTVPFGGKTSDNSKEAKTEAPVLSFGSTTTTPSLGGASAASDSSTAPTFRGNDAPSFGATATTPSFGAPTTTAAPFPAEPSSASDTTTPTFGSTSTPSFGGASSTPAASTPSFGGASSSTPAASTPSFGGASSSTPAASTPSFGGASSTPAASTPSFGGASSTPAASTPSFGGASSTPAASTPSFGGASSSTPAASTPSFGGASSSTPAASTPSFGGASSTPAASTPSFGGASSAPAPTFGGAASSAAPSFGSGNAPTFGGATPAIATPTAAPNFGASAAPSTPSFSQPAFKTTPQFGGTNTGFTGAAAAATPPAFAGPATGFTASTPLNTSFGGAGAPAQFQGAAPQQAPQFGFQGGAAPAAAPSGFSGAPQFGGVQQGMPPQQFGGQAPQFGGAQPGNVFSATSKPGRKKLVARRRRKH